MARRAEGFRRWRASSATMRWPSGPQAKAGATIQKITMERMKVLRMLLDFIGNRNPFE